MTPPSVYRSALLAALVTFLLGFVALNLLYFCGPVDETVRGLYSYSSATLGDGLFLPMSIAGLVFLVRQRHRRSLTLEIVAALAGIIAGASIVYGWVADPNPDLNWTLPQPHILSAPGWYHGVFLTAMAGVVCWGVARAVSGRLKSQQRTLDRVGIPLVLVGVIGFGSTLIADNIDVNTAGARATLIGLALAIGLVVILVGASLARSRARGRRQGKDELG